MGRSQGTASKGFNYCCVGDEVSCSMGVSGVVEQDSPFSFSIEMNLCIVFLEGR